MSVHLFIKNPCVSKTEPHTSPSHSQSKLIKNDTQAISDIIWALNKIHILPFEVNTQKQSILRPMVGKSHEQAILHSYLTNEERTRQLMAELLQTNPRDIFCSNLALLGVSRWKDTTEWLLQRELNSTLRRAFYARIVNSKLILPFSTGRSINDALESDRSWTWKWVSFGKGQSLNKQQVLTASTKKRKKRLPSNQAPKDGQVS